MVTIATLVGLPVVVFQGAPWKTTNDDQQVIHLTALKKSGVWTQSEVNGLTYWWKSFQPVTLVLRQRDPVYLRLTSSDVTHSFYVPELFPEPVIVKAGFTKELMLVPERSGEFTYYCITVCGECHYMMRGTVHVLPEHAATFNIAPATEHTCIHKLPKPATESLLTHGKYLFRDRGCYTCHGNQGQGGVYNPNYVNRNVPQLNTLAERMKLYWEDDVDTIITLLERGAELEALAVDPPIEGYYRFLAQYSSIRDKIRNGSPEVQKLDSEGPQPPLTMPSWEYQLTDRDIDALIVYLLSLYPWEAWD